MWMWQGLGVSTLDFHSGVSRFRFPPRPGCSSSSFIKQSLIERAMLVTWVTKQYFGNGDKNEKFLFCFAKQDQNVPFWSIMVPYKHASSGIRTWNLSICLS